MVIKICGITCAEDALTAVVAGANALGFNFYRKSPRFIPVEKAREIVSEVPGPYTRVGIFVNASHEEMDRAANTVPLDVVQLHGEACELPAKSNVRVWRSIAPSCIPPDDPGVEAWLIDTPSAHFGGSGQTFRWADVECFPYREIIAGGLDASNVAAAISEAMPWGVDACSRLESRPGKKDAARVRAFVQAARAAFKMIGQEVSL